MYLQQIKLSVTIAETKTLHRQPISLYPSPP